MTHTNPPPFTLVRANPERTTTTHATRLAARIYAFCVYGVPLSAWLDGRRHVDECTHGGASYRVTDGGGGYRAR
jgi:hypothetical protein